MVSHVCKDVWSCSKPWCTRPHTCDKGYTRREELTAPSFHLLECATAPFKKHVGLALLQATLLRKGKQRDVKTRVGTTEELCGRRAGRLSPHSPRPRTGRRSGSLSPPPRWESVGSCSIPLPRSSAAPPERRGSPRPAGPGCHGRTGLLTAPGRTLPPQRVRVRKGDR